MKIWNNLFEVVVNIKSCWNETRLLFIFLYFFQLSFKNKMAKILNLGFLKEEFWFNWRNFDLNLPQLYQNVKWLTQMKRLSKILILIQSIEINHEFKLWLFDLNRSSCFTWFIILNKFQANLKKLKHKTLKTIVWKQLVSFCIELYFNWKNLSFFSTNGSLCLFKVSEITKKI